MGSPISVVLAELTMQKIEKSILTNPPSQPLIWKRYLDDIITVLPRNSTEEFLNFINSINSDIKFTVETENNNKLPYLDLEIVKQNNG